MSLNRRTFAAGAATSLATLSSSRTFGQTTPNATPVSSELESKLAAVMAQNGVTGAVFAHQTAGADQPTFYELGIADLETGAPIAADMHFRIASITKTFVATVILQLISEGSLAFDDTIADILPTMDVAGADQVTVHHLLSMRSGLPQLIDSPDAMLMMMYPTVEVSFQDLIDAVAGMPARFDPDAMWDYNNLNFNILGEMINMVTGQTWDANVDARIAKPLSLRSTSMTNSPEMPSPFAHGYGFSVGAASPGAAASPVAEDKATQLLDMTLFNPTIAGAAGGLISTVADQLTWVRSLAAGSLLTEEMHAAQIDTQPIGMGSPVKYGLGVLELDGLYGHNGAINGYQSASLSSPDGSLSGAVLTNTNPLPLGGDAAFQLLITLLS